MIPVSGDWDGNGTDTIGAYLPAQTPGQDATWDPRNSNTPGDPDMQIRYGGYGMLPVSGDWTGLGHDAIGAYLPATSQGDDATWDLRNSLTPGPADLQFKYGGAVAP